MSKSSGSGFLTHKGMKTRIPKAPSETPKGGRIGKGEIGRKGTAPTPKTLGPRCA